MEPEQTIGGGGHGGERFFAKTKFDGEEILALLDTGASANCIGRGAHAFLKNRTRPIKKLCEECVRTASGGETQVPGAITLPVEWEGETKDLEFLELISGIRSASHSSVRVDARLPSLKQHPISTL